MHIVDDWQCVCSVSRTLRGPVHGSCSCSGKEEARTVGMMLLLMFLGTFGSYRDVNKCVLDALYT